MDMELTRHRFIINCLNFKTAAKDICIHGLGWISVTGKGECTFDVIAPKGVEVSLRNPLMPFEANYKVLNKVRGKTVNLERWTMRKRQRINCEWQSHTENKLLLD